MTIKVSSGLRNGLLVDNPLKALLEAGDGMTLKIYSGSPPTTADDAVPGGATLLVDITDDDTGNGLIFDTGATGGVLAKDSDQTWRGVNDNMGTATWFRLVADGDSGSASASEPRIQGSVGVAGEDVNLANVELTSGEDQRITSFNVTLPTL